MHETFDHAEFETVQPPPPASEKAPDLEGQLALGQERRTSKRTSTLTSTVQNLFSFSSDARNPYARARALDKQRELADAANLSPTVHIIDLKKPAVVAALSSLTHSRQSSEDSMDLAHSRKATVRSMVSSWDFRDTGAPLTPLPEGEDTMESASSQRDSSRWLPRLSIASNVTFSSQLRRSFMQGGIATPPPMPSPPPAAMFTTSIPPPPPSYPRKAAQRASADKLTIPRSSSILTRTSTSASTRTTDTIASHNTFGVPARKYRQSRPAVSAVSGGSLGPSEGRPRPKVRTSHLLRHPAVGLEVSPDPFRNDGLKLGRF